MKQALISLLGAAGGTALVIIGLFKFFGVKIIEIVLERIKNNELVRVEKEKAIISNSVYVTQQRYNKLFQIYEELNTAYFDICEIMMKLIPNNGEEGIKDIYPVNDKRLSFIEKNNETFKELYDKTKKVTMKNCLFIEEEQSSNYMKMLELLNKQVILYEKVASDKRIDYLKDDDFKRTGEINDLVLKNNKIIRAYIKSLEIID